MFGQTTTAALGRAVDLGVDVRVLNLAGGTYHPKLYLSRRGEKATALVGSANLTSGLLRNIEVGALLSGAAGDVSLRRLRNLAEGWWADPATVPFLPQAFAVTVDRMLPDLWRRLASAVPAGTVARTLAAGRPNRVVEITQEAVWVETERSTDRGRGPEPVPAWMLNVAWEHLTAHGRLTNAYLLASDGLNVKRSSAVCALLAALPGVEVISRGRPIELAMRRDELPRAAAEDRAGYGPRPARKIDYPEGAGMLVRRAGGPWEQPPVQAYANEAELQTLIAASPELVAELDGVACVTVTELSIPAAGYLDVVLVALDGSLTLVEAKLNRNPEIRRAVVGQLLGYAGGLWRMSYEMFDAAIRQRTHRSLLELATTQAGDDGLEEERFRESVAWNLHEGEFRLVFAVDKITEDLKRAVEYLNARTVAGTEVVVVELGYAKVDDIEILLPRSFGEEAARTKRAARSTPRWTETDLFAQLEESATAEEVACARRLFEWAAPRVHRLYWGEGQHPSVTMTFEAPEGMVQPCSIYTGSGSNGIGINFDWVRRRPKRALASFLEEIEQLPTIARAGAEILAKDFAKRPTVPLNELVGDGIEQLIGGLERLLTHPPEAASEAQPI